MLGLVGNPEDLFSFDAVHFLFYLFISAWSTNIILLFLGFCMEMSSISFALEFTVNS